MQVKRVVIDEVAEWDVTVRSEAAISICDGTVQVRKPQFAKLLHVSFYWRLIALSLD